MVRVGGGWDTLERYFDKHDPCKVSGDNWNEMKWCNTVENERVMYRQHLHFPLVIVSRIIAFDIACYYVIFRSRGFYDVPRVLIAYARWFQALAAILDRLTHLASNLCWYRFDARQDEFKLLHYELIKVRSYEHVCRRLSAKKTRKS